MPGRLSDEIIEQIRAGNDIVGLISEYVPLKKQGKNFVGLCPFHQESKPSFSVSPERQIFHCFGCAMGGNVFKFLMEYQKMSFLEAVKFLAEKAHIILPERDAGFEDRSRYEPLYKANHLAAAHYHQQLLENVDAEKARQYLQQRGYTSETITGFRLGYAPPGWDGLMTRARRHRMPPETLQKAGLVLKREYGEGYYDRFRDRLIFPISNLSGKFIAFGGRILQESDEVKYINSPETAIYQKGKTLYGLYQTKEAIRRAGKAVIVEGYTDLLSLFQAGVTNVVASLGTALTAQQARLLSRYAREVILFYDADSAGVAAAQRGVDVLLEEGLFVRVLSLDTQMDPDDVVRQKGSEFLLTSLEKAGSFLHFQLQQLTGRDEYASVPGKAEAIEKIGRTLSLIRDPIQKGLYISEAAELLGVDEKLVVLAVDKAAPRPGGASKKAPAGPERVITKGGELFERKILALLLQNPELVAHIEGRVSPEDFTIEAHRRIAEHLLAAGKELTGKPASIINTLSDNRLESLVSELCFLDEEGQVDRLLEDYVRKIEKDRILRQERELREQLRNAEKKKDRPLVERLTRRLSEIAQQRYQSTTDTP